MNDLKLIKDKYGEKMMHFCRVTFPTILEKPGLLFSLLKDNFEFNKFLYEDIQNQGMEDMFKNYIYSLLDEEKPKNIVDKTPKELLSEIGYDLYECKTEEEIQYFKKYYAENEALCTFNGGRLNRCHVFFAVKKDAENIKRSENPRREDEYGTSVISIQFTKGETNTLSIKNRYNHTVNNPDATFSNCLENIVPGLTESFEKIYNLNINQIDSEDFYLDGYVYANDGKFYKYNYEINNIYYCPNNIIIDNYNVIRDYEEKEKYIIIDYFILDLVNKKIITYDDTLFDAFVDDIKNINKIDIIKDKSTQNKFIKLEKQDGKTIYIELDKTNKIISYANNDVERIGNCFLEYNTSLENLEMKNVKKIGHRFCFANKNLNNLSLENTEKIGHSFLQSNMTINSINLPNVREVGNEFLYNNRCLINLNMPKLEKAGAVFLYTNRNLEQVYLPELREVSRKFLYSSVKIKEAILPKLTTIDSSFMYWNDSLIQLDLPSLITVEDYFLSRNNSLLYLNCPNLESASYEFLTSNRCLKIFNAPNLKDVKSDILNKKPSINKQILKNVANKEKEKVKTLTKK